MSDELASRRADVELAPYALESLEERMITRILEREDEGYVRWTPRAIYEQLAIDNPALYPPEPPRGLLDRFLSPAFADKLAARRLQRRVSQLPAAMLADSIGRRLVDLTVPILFDGLDQGDVSISEARKILKDALTYIKSNEEFIRGPEESTEKEQESSAGISFEEAMKLIGVAAPDRKEVIARFLAAQLVNAAEMMNAEEAEVVDETV